MKMRLSTNTLKIWAIIAMVCDHAPYLTEALKAHYYDTPWFLLHAFGRLTAPVFFYLLALGYRRTRDANKYTLRLLVFALITYVPYVWYFYYTPPNSMNFHELNVIFTMLFGLLLLRSVHEVRSVPVKVLCIVLCLIGGYWCDYGLYGLALILVCDACRGSRGGTVLGMAAVMMTYAYVRFSSVFTSDAGPLEYFVVMDANPRIIHLAVVMLAHVVPLILIAGHRVWGEGASAIEGKPAFLGKWGFYIFYPAHITVLLLIRLFII